jgi:glycosyltransferase involved in cell wall biosynthesis
MMRISVTMATYNGGRWLVEQLDSLADQTRMPDELVVCDDGSTDSTPDILREFAGRAPFPVRIFIQPNRLGVTGNMQSAIAAADADVIAPCDQDDVWHPDKLELFEKAFAAEAELDMVFCDADVVGEELEPMGYSLWDAVGFDVCARRRARRDGLASILVKFNVVTGTAMAFASRRRDLILPIPGEWLHDGWIGMLLVVAGRCKWIEKPLLAYRQHPHQQIGAANRSWRQQIQVARKMDAAYFDCLARNFQECLERLQQRNATISPKERKMLREKIEHCQARRDMRHSALGKPIAVTRELLRCRYGRLSLGWKSVMQDLLLT